MRAVEHAVVNSLLHLRGFDDGVDRQQVDLQVLARHGMDAVDIALGVLQENSATPSRLNLQDLGFGDRDIRRSDGPRNSWGSGNTGTFEKFTTCGF